MKNELPTFERNSYLTLVIQAGGESSRMGQNKALIPFQGKPMIERILHRLAPVTDRVLVVCNDPDDLNFLGVDCVTDRLPGRGPLGGLYTALVEAGTPWVAVVACDMPFASPTLVKKEENILNNSPYDVVMPVVPKGKEPLHALYRREHCLGPVQNALNQGEMRLTAFLSKVNVFNLFLDENEMDIPPHTFFNVNTPQDLVEAERLAQIYG